MFSRYLRSLCRFRKTSVSILLVVTYAVIGALYVWDRIKYQYNGPLEKSEQLLLDDGWLSLQEISQSPHEYISKQNDIVHDYILHKVESLTDKIPYAEVSDDYRNKNRILFRQPDVFNSSSQDTRVISFESSNVMVKLEGSDPNLDGLLLSAHFDSVPTGFGATDDGMGIVSLLAVLEKLSKEQPRRTVIFNFNNNEEFGLLGSSAFFNHPWSKLVHYILNLEGAGAGGKAVLFRTSDTSTASIYKAAVRDQPFGNSMYQQAFYERYISSETDYKVYEQKGLRGWDIAFYKPRDLYHTAKDSIAHTSKASLWHMMQAALQISDYMANGDVVDDPQDRVPAVYFDVLGSYFVSIRAKTLFTTNCVLLGVVPITLLTLQLIASRKNHNKTKSTGLWLRLPISVAASYAFIATGRSILFRKNPLIFSRDYLSPTIGFCSSFIAVNYLILSFFEFWSPSRDFKTVALIELSFAFWICLLLATIRLYTEKYQATGFYSFTAIYVLTSISAAIGLICAAFRPKQVKIEPSLPVDDARDDSVGDLSNAETTAEVQSNEEPDERAPLLNHYSARNSVATQPSKTDKNDFKAVMKQTLNYDWSLQFAILVPLASMFMFTCLFQLLDAASQTCQDGFQATWNVSMISMLGAIFVALPLLPFSYKLNYFVAMLIIGVSACSGILSYLKEPFTESSPLKLRFSQEVHLHDDDNLATVKVYGRQGTGMGEILRDLPSLKRSNTSVSCQSNGQGLETCSYPGLLPNIVSSRAEMKPSDVMKIEVLSNNRNSPTRSPYEPIYAEVRIKALENRLCTVVFNSSRYADFTFGQSPVKQVTVFESILPDNRTAVHLPMVDGLSTDEDGNRVFKWSKGINSLQLHKLDFERNYYRIGIQWVPKIISQDTDEEMTDALGLQVRCSWGDYDSVSIVNDEPKRRVPAYDELLAYSPATISLANREAGMVMFDDYLVL
ncbi:LAME_0E02586g1_1 [Lachancea meyersii CBS 8951]|uniref:Peptide hydrolase n=1 Tax=Lachancea meyersii CBS 8951 TaxID=1266667 RepID=A0A1G4JGR5_9SACH|nr:LAME_0E02586g1_1 [Lachancea meyersii CBS 8951]